MSYTHENSPQQDPVLEQFLVEDWLNARNYRDIARIQRDVLLGEVRSALSNLELTLATNGGLSYYSAYGNDAEYRIMITNFIRLAEAGNTIISVNKIRHTHPTEPQFPHGQAMELADIVIPPTSRWLNSGSDTLYRPINGAWGKPVNATRIQARNDSLQLIGNLQIPGFTPQRAKDPYDVAQDAQCLWAVHEALLLCGASTLCEGVISVTTE